MSTSLQPRDAIATVCTEPTDPAPPAGIRSGSVPPQSYAFEHESVEEHRRNIQQLRALGDDAEIRAAIARRLQLIAALTPQAA